MSLLGASLPPLSSRESGEHPSILSSGLCQGEHSGGDGHAGERGRTLGVTFPEGATASGWCGLSDLALDHWPLQRWPLLSVPLTFSGQGGSCVPGKDPESRGVGGPQLPMPGLPTI